MKFSSLLITLLIITTPIFAQLNGGSGGFHIGFKRASMDSYNYFTPENLDGFENNLTRVGGGGYWVINNVVIGGSGFSIRGDVKNTSLTTPIAGNYEYALKGGGGYLNVGYVVYGSPFFLVFPMVGFGFEGVSMIKSFDEDIMFQEGNLLSSEYSWSSPMLDIGLGIDFFPFPDYGVKMGFRIGYNLSLSNTSEWYYQGGEVLNDDLPDHDLNGLYLTFVIGGGWVSEGI